MNKQGFRKTFCRQRDDSPQKYCLSFYVRLTVFSTFLGEIYYTSNKLKDRHFISDVSDMILNNIQQEKKTVKVELLVTKPALQSTSLPEPVIKAVKVEVFAKSGLQRTGLTVDYFVVKLLLERYSVIGIYSSPILNNLHRKLIKYDGDVFFSEVEFYDEIIDSRGEIYIESQTYWNHSVDKLIVFGFDEYKGVRSCVSRREVKLHKTNICPYLKLNINEIPMTLIDGTLTLNGQYLKMSLSKFEHKVHDDTVYICLEDYMLFYNAESGQTTNDSAVSCYSHVFVVLLMISSLFDRLLFPIT